MTDVRDPVRLGATVRARRQALGLTLVELGRLSGLSHPFLSQVERGLARPSLASLERVCQALGTSEVELFWGAGRDDAPSPRAARRARVVRGRDAVRGGYGAGSARVLARGQVAFVPIEVRGTNTAAGPFHRHAEEEFVHVVAGTVVVDLGSGRPSRLRPGDSLYLDGGTPHRWSSPDGGAYHLLVVKQRLPSAPPLPSTRRRSTPSASCEGA